MCCVQSEPGMWLYFPFCCYNMSRNFTIYTQVTESDVLQSKHIWKHAVINIDWWPAGFCCTFTSSKGSCWCTTERLANRMSQQVCFSSTPCCSLSGLFLLENGPKVSFGWSLTHSCYYSNFWVLNFCKTICLPVCLIRTIFEIRQMIKTFLLRRAAAHEKWDQWTAFPRWCWRI